MINQLLLSKRLFGEASQYADKPDAVSCGIAVSLLQDAAEILVWALIKQRGISVKEGSAFTTNLDLLQKDGASIPEMPKLLELNKARVGFKHYGNLPAPAEAQKHRNYVEDFLRSAVKTHFKQDFDGLSLVDLVPFPDIKARLRSAEEHIAKSEFKEAVQEASIAKAELFSKLSKYVPHVDHKLSDFDGVLAKLTELRSVQVFKYLEQYLGVLREISLVTLLRLPLDDYGFLTGTLFTATQSMAGTWRTTDGRFLKHDESTCRRQIACLVEVSIRLQSVV
jgi:hypothetical protein